MLRDFIDFMLILFVVAADDIPTRISTKHMVVAIVCWDEMDERMDGLDCTNGSHRRLLPPFPFVWIHLID